jgi:ubiquinone/menaquinone biosynthesis C-methylase UbiE
MDPKTMWGAGDWDSVASRILGVGEVCVERARVEAGMDVLDVACGTGNATYPAARAGARVTGLDFQPDLLALAREKASAAGVEIEWVEGDAQQLPFEDDRFDRVLSTFGHMFAPDHERAAAELKRVTRGDGAISICCWSPDGSIGRMFRATAEFAPPPPGASSPLLWGTEDHVRALLGDGDFARHEVEWIDDSVETYANWMLESFGPLVNAQEALGERSGELRDAYLRHLEAENLSSDGTFRYRGEYLAAVVRPG